MIPTRRENRDSGSTPPYEPVGIVERSIFVPDPYDKPLNASLNRMRAQLFDLIEVSVDPERQEPVKRQVRTITLRAWNDARRVVNGILDQKATA